MFFFCTHNFLSEGCFDIYVHTHFLVANVVQTELNVKHFTMCLKKCKLKIKKLRPNNT